MTNYLLSKKFVLQHARSKLEQTFTDFFVLSCLQSNFQFHEGYHPVGNFQLTSRMMSLQSITKVCVSLSNMFLLSNTGGQSKAKELICKKRYIFIVLSSLYVSKISALTFQVS